MAVLLGAGSSPRVVPPEIVGAAAAEVVDGSELPLAGTPLVCPVEEGVAEAFAVGVVRVSLDDARRS